jgi:hypothetical protein
VATGQCAVDPVTGISGAIWNAWIGDPSMGLAAAALVSGSSTRALLAAKVQAIAASIDTASTGDHALGASVTWSAGNGAGQYEFGAACPNGVLVSISGCDEGGTISFTTGLNTASGIMFTLHFGTSFPHAPAALFFPADATAAALIYGFQTWATATTSAVAFHIASPAANQTLTFHWTVKGRT